MEILLNSSTRVSMNKLKAPAHTHSDTVLATWKPHPPSSGYHFLGSSPEKNKKINKIRMKYNKIK